MWGVAEPVAGAMADRWGPRPVMIGGALMLAAGTALIPLATSPWALIVVLGVMFAAGAGTSGPAQLASAVSRWIPEAKRSVGNGIIGAGGSFGQFILIPFAQLCIGLAGSQPALGILSITGLVAIPLGLYVTAATPVTGATQIHASTLHPAMPYAMRHPS